MRSAGVEAEVLCTAARMQAQGGGGRGGRTCARTDSMFQGHMSTCVQARSCGGSRHRRCPHTSTTETGPARIAVYIASCTHGVAASAVGPKLVGPVRCPALTTAQGSAALLA